MYYRIVIDMAEEVSRWPLHPPPPPPSVALIGVDLRTAPCRAASFACCVALYEDAERNCWPCFIGCRRLTISKTTGKTALHISFK